MTEKLLELTEKSEQKHIEYAMPPKAHTPMYLMHKWWARKPHNVVREYIEQYSRKGDIVLDPFCGSGPTPVEAVKSGRKAIAIDLDPMATFITRMTMMPINLKKFEDAFEQIKKNVEKKINSLYETTCDKCGRKAITLVAIWREKSTTPVELRFFCPSCKKRRKKPSNEDIQKINGIGRMKVPCWYPKAKLRYPNGEEFKEGTHIGIDKISDLFTKRNLVALSIIFHEIESLEENEIKDLMKFAFTSMVHLASKMTPDRPTRPYSSFWPVHRYWIPPQFMESNVWVRFESATTGKQGILKGKHESNNEIIHYREARTFDDFEMKDANIMIKTYNVLELTDIVHSNSVDYVFTDPPYGGAIQYMELSTLWVSWLKGENDDKRFELDFDNEITVNKKQQKSFEEYHRMLYASFRKIFDVLKPGKYMTVTFHSTDIKVWNSIVRAVVFAGFDLEKIVYQPPARTSAKALLQPYGSAIGDYYIRFRKPRKPRRKLTEEDVHKEQYERIVVETAEEIIAKRGEPTPFTHILNGIIPALDKSGMLLRADKDIAAVLREHLDKEFVLIIVKKGEKKVGQKWWLKDPSSIHIDLVPLNERVEKAVINVLNREYSATFDKILQEIFTTFANALTPDSQSVRDVLGEYANVTKSGKWQLKPSIRRRENEHSMIAGYLGVLGRNAGYKVWIAPDERGKSFDGQPLSKLSERSLSLSNVSSDDLERIKRIDVLWIKNGGVAYEFDVENTTGVTEAILRGSHISTLATKFAIVIPDERLKMVERKFREPILESHIRKRDWRIITYGKLQRFYNKCKAQKKVDLSEFQYIMSKPTMKLERESQTTVTEFAR